MPYAIDKMPFGFPFVLFGQQIGAFSASMCSTLNICVHLTLNLYIIAAINDMQVSLSRLDELLIGDRTNNAQLTLIYAHLTDILKFHCWIIQ